MPPLQRTGQMALTPSSPHSLTTHSGTETGTGTGYEHQ